MSAAKAALKRPLAAAFDGALGGHGQRIIEVHLRAFEVKEEGGEKGGGCREQQQPPPKTCEFGL